MDKADSLVIRTPEGVEFSMVLAGPVSRFLAWVVDLTVIAVAYSIMMAFLAAFEALSLDLARAAGLVAYFLIAIGYAMTAEWFWRGQTVGKRVFGLRVIDVQGLRLRPSQIVVRNLMRFVDGLPLFYFVGGVSCLMSRYAQRLGDLAANTTVVRTPKLAEPDLDRLLVGKYNSLRDYPHLGARLRQKVTPGEASVALRALLRRDYLTPEARVELFGQIAAHLKSVVEFPAEATEGVSDEQYVNNVVDVLFRSPT